MAVERPVVYSLKRCKSYELLPPDISELRLVLLGNSWSQRCSVGNFLLGHSVFDSRKTSDLYRVSEPFQDKKIAIINTPDLLQPDLPEDKLTELITEIAEACAPGPHVFLLVLEPEDFTEQHKSRLLSVLESFSDQAFHHSLVLISQTKDMTPSARAFYMNALPLKDIVRKCRYRKLMKENLELEELFIRLGQIAKENSGKHVSLSHHQKQEGGPHLSTKKSSPSYVSSDPGKKAASAIRIALFGKSDDKKTKIGNILIGNQDLHSASQHCVATCCNVNGTLLTVVKTPDIFSLSKPQVKEEMRSCVSLCSPGPNVLLLVVKPSEFTEDNRQTLNSVLSLFGPDVFKHSMVVIIPGYEKTDPVDRIISDCEDEYCLFEQCSLLLEKINFIESKNSHSFLTLTEQTSLNLVLCGRTGVKTSVVESILGRAELPTASSPEQCVQLQGEVCGRWVSLVELPALSGKPLETVMQLCLSCISLCGPEGVHAFILVLPVGPLTDEDKAEIKTIQDTFSSKVNLYTMILFTVSSDPSAPAVVNFVKEDRDLQELSQSCGGGYLIFNTRGQQQVSELLESVETLKANNKSHSYTSGQQEVDNMEKTRDEPRTGFTKHMFTEVLMKRVLEKGIRDRPVVPNNSRECLRIVVIGRTGNGKSATANTILGRTHFKSVLHPKSVTKLCEKEEGEVDGQKVVVVDTPGLFDTSLTNDQVQEELVKCITLLAPGPHVFLLVLRLDRFTNEEKQSVDLIKKYFGKKSSPFIIILFTKGDNLENEMSIETYIQESDESLKKIIRDCGGRFQVFNNKDKNNHSQVQQLLEKANKMVLENGGSYYTTEMFQEAEVAIKKAMKKLLQEKEEEMKRKEEELRDKHKQEIKAIERRMRQEKAEIDQRRQREITELEEKINREKALRNFEHKQREIEDRERKEQEDQERLQWKKKVEALEEKIKCESQSKQTIDKRLEMNRAEMRRQEKAWEREKEEWWEKRISDNKKIRLQESIRIKTLQEEIHKKKEEDQFRQKQEEKQLQELIQNHHKELEMLKHKYESEARKQAEELNEFKAKYSQDFDALIERHGDQITDLKEQHEEEVFRLQEQHQTDYHRLHSLSSFKEESLKAELSTKDKDLQDEIERNVQLINQHKDEQIALKKQYKKDCTIC